MSRFGNSLAKVLSLVTAFLTVATGVPHVRCVCPDGRVMHFCSGPLTSGCCGPTSEGISARGEPDGKSSCCYSAGERAGRCDSCGSSERSSGTTVVERCACERSLVVEAVGTPTEKADDATQTLDHAPLDWATHRVPVVVASRLPRFLLPPPDRVVEFCHFTC